MQHPTQALAKGMRSRRLRQIINLHGQKSKRTGYISQILHLIARPRANRSSIPSSRALKTRAVPQSTHTVQRANDSTRSERHATQECKADGRKGTEARAGGRCPRKNVQRPREGQRKLRARGASEAQISDAARKSDATHKSHHGRAREAMISHRAVRGRPYLQQVRTNAEADGADDAEEKKGRAGESSPGTFGAAASKTVDEAHQFFDSQQGSRWSTEETPLEYISARPYIDSVYMRAAGLQSIVYEYAGGRGGRRRRANTRCGGARSVRGRSAPPNDPESRCF